MESILQNWGKLPVINTGGFPILEIVEAYQYTYIALAVLLWTAGYFHTGRFVRPRWKIPGKLLFYIAGSVAFVLWFGHFGSIFILGHPLLGLFFHIKICKKHGIDWRTCTPREKYMALQEKWAKGGFSDIKNEQ